MLPPWVKYGLTWSKLLAYAQIVIRDHVYGKIVCLKCPSYRRSELQSQKLWQYGDYDKSYWKNPSLCAQYVNASRGRLC